jgi:hypothetical protein
MVTEECIRETECPGQGHNEGLGETKTAQSVLNVAGKEGGAWLFRECAQASVGCIGRPGLYIPATISTL